MPSTTIASGYKSDVRVDSAAGALTNVSGSTNAWSATINNQLGTFFTFDSAWQQVSDGGKSLQLQITALYSPTADEGHDLFTDWIVTDPAGKRTVRIDYNTASGHKRIEGEFGIQSANTGANAGEGAPAQVQVTLMSHGAVTISETTT